MTLERQKARQQSVMKWKAASGRYWFIYWLALAPRVCPVQSLALRRFRPVLGGRCWRKSALLGRNDFVVRGVVINNAWFERGCCILWPKRFRCACFNIRNVKRCNLLSTVIVCNCYKVSLLLCFPYTRIVLFPNIFNVSVLNPVNLILFSSRFHCIFEILMWNSYQRITWIWFIPCEITQKSAILTPTLFDFGENWWINSTPWPKHVRTIFALGGLSGQI